MAEGAVFSVYGSGFRVQGVRWGGEGRVCLGVRVGKY